MFTPINLPPTEHHQFSTGHSTENGDNAKTVGEKINAGFKHVYTVLAGMGASLADEVEYVAKTEFDALVHELDETKAELANLKMMVQGLGFAGAKPAVLATQVLPQGIDTNPVVTITDPGFTHTFTDPQATSTGMSWGGLIAGGEPVVTVKEVSDQ